MSLNDDEKQALRIRLGTQTMAISDLMTDDDVIESVIALKCATHDLVQLIVNNGAIDHQVIPSIVCSVVIEELLRPTPRDS